MLYDLDIRCERGDLRVSTTRIDIRLQSEAKDLIQRAAELRNQTVTQFAVSTLTEAAGRVVAEHERRELSDGDRDLFLKLLVNPTAPTAKLRCAAASHGKSVAQ